MSSDAHFGGDDNKPDPLVDVPTECYDVLRHPQRIRLFEILESQRTRLTLSELTTELIDAADPDVSNGQARHDVRVGLRHNHLPRLADRDIVDWNDDGVELVDEPPVHPSDISGLYALCESEDADRLLDAIVDPVRMRLLSLLEGQGQPLSLEQLGAKLAAYDGGAFADADRAKIALHHSHLPALDAVGALHYDPESGLVTPSENELSILQ